jgi:glutamine synthetase
MAAPLTTDELTSGDFDTVIITAPDMAGRLIGKRVAPSRFGRLVDEGVAVSSCILGWDLPQDVGLEVPYAGWHTGWRDILLRPDLATLRPAAWLQRTAVVVADMVEPDTGEPVAVAPRSVLKAVTDRVRGTGVHPAVGTELEFFVYREGYDALRTDGYRSLTPTTLAHADYTVQQVNAWEHVFQPLRAALDASGLQAGLSQGEWGLGQWEINLDHGDPVDMCDRHVLFKLAVRDHMSRHGLAATFMPKPVADQVGSSCHVHLSLTDTAGAPLMYESGARHAMSAAFGHVVAGLLEHAPAFMAFYAPTVNSYRRTTSSEFAGHGATWGYDNRTVSCRVVGEHPHDLRAEWRVPGADTNPYLAVAGVLASAADGLARALTPPAEQSGDAYQVEVTPLPRDLDAAAAALRASGLAREWLGDLVVEQYALTAEWEADCFRRAVTDWEKARYFESFLPSSAIWSGRPPSWATLSTSLRSTQNSLPSGSARTAQPRKVSGSRRSSTIVAPRARRRSTSSSRVRSVGTMSRWRRFFTVLPSGTRTNSSPVGLSGWTSSHSGSPGEFG